MIDIKERTAKVLAEVMEVEADTINDESSPDTLEEWDSLAHVQVVLGLEKEFGIKISPEDGIEHFTSFGDIVTFLSAQ
jgi:acyl carrier protein